MIDHIDGFKALPSGMGSLQPRMADTDPGLAPSPTELPPIPACLSTLERDAAIGRALIEHLPDGMLFVFDHDLRYLVASGHATDCPCATAHSLIGHLLDEVVPPELCATLKPIYQAAIAGTTTTCQISYYQHIYHIHARPLYDTSAQIVAGFIISHDITNQVHTEHRLHESQTLLAGVLDYSPTAIAIRDRGGRFLLVNQRYCAMFSVSEAELIGHTPDEVFPPDIARCCVLHDEHVLTTGQPTEFELSLQLNDQMHTFLTIQFPLMDENGMQYALAGIFMDITERKQTEQAFRTAHTRLEQRVQERTAELCAREHYYHALVHNSTDLISVCDVNGVVRYVSPSVTRMLGYHPDELVGQSSFTLLHPEDHQIITTSFACKTRPNHPTIPVEMRYRHKDGTWRWLEAVTTNLLHDPVVQGMVVNARDITERKRYEAQIEQLAFTDRLTGLPNRNRLYQVGHAAITTAHAQDEMIALLYLDVDRFKAINGTLGHDVGDELLIQMAHRLRLCIDTKHLLTRLGGDEFAVLMQCDSIVEPLAIARTMLAELSLPFTLRGQTIHLRGSIGIALSTDSAAPFSTLLTQADIAMYGAKAHSGDIQVYHPMLQSISRNQLQLETDLRYALKTNGLSLYYQPILDLHNAQIVCVEALVRWHHSQQGLLFPGAFLPIAEEAGLLDALDNWVLHTAIAQAATWANAGYPLTITINLTAQSLEKPHLVYEVADLLATYYVPADRIIIELTEHTALRNLTATRHILAELKALGLRIALDDFGSGYASLTHLRELPVDVLKLDRAFATGIGRETRDEAVVQALLMLADGLDLTVVVEGIERPEQLAWLQKIGDPLVQGYLIAPPISAHELLARIQLTGEMRWRKQPIFFTCGPMETTPVSPKLSPTTKN
mgnify:CR=1 FL=1